MGTVVHKAPHSFHQHGISTYWHRLVQRLPNFFVWLQSFQREWSTWASRTSRTTLSPWSTWASRTSMTTWSPWPGPGLATSLFRRGSVWVPATWLSSVSQDTLWSPRRHRRHAWRETQVILAELQRWKDGKLRGTFKRKCK